MRHGFYVLFFLISLVVNRSPKTSMRGTIVCSLLGLIPLGWATTHETPQYYKALAINGDGVYALLRRYDLDKHLCNFQQFYTLNRLKEGSHLLAGREYFLPIMLYAFDGKTIRSSIGNNDWDLAVRIQRYNERMLEAKLREASFQENRELWVPYHEFHCPEARLNSTVPEPAKNEEVTPPIDAGEKSDKGKRYFPIFGPKYANVPLESEKLKGKVYYVSSGHGGPDPGAMAQRGRQTLCEDEYAYDVALRLCRNLIAHGATAYMIVRDYDDGIRGGSYLPCDYDEVLWGDVEMMRQVRARLFQRSNVVNQLYDKHLKQGVKEQYLIAIHVDSRSKGEQIDLFFYHKPGDEASRKLAEQLQRTMRNKYQKHRSSGKYHGTVSPRDLHMLRETLPTSVYIELGNIRNSFDQQRILLESNRRALAAWLLEGFLE
jgi:N-acetylmuramoyl-L-alanine amidase